MGCTSLASIIIPEAVTSIGHYAFGGCTSLASIIIPDSVSSIGAHAFPSCYGYGLAIAGTDEPRGRVSCLPCGAQREVVVPANVTSIGVSAISGCTSLASINIPDSVTTIDANAFEDGCNNLASIIIPRSTNVDEYAFYNCACDASQYQPGVVLFNCTPNSTWLPSSSPTLTRSPTLSPATSDPTQSPSRLPTVSPSISPTLPPTVLPSLSPTSSSPTASPTLSPTGFPCSAEQYWNGTFVPAMCVNVSVCNAGATYETEPPTMSSDRVCRGTSSPCVDNVSYETVQPTATSDRSCVDVSKVCGGGLFVNVAATYTSDTGCAVCTATCPTGQVQGVACGVDHDMQCTPEQPWSTGAVTAGGSALAAAVVIALLVWLRRRRQRRRRGSAYHALEMSDIPSSSLSPPPPTEVFLSHNWGDDDLGRDNHARVVKINDLLVDAGYVTWCDSEQMIGDVVDRMVEGIDHTQAVIVFVTKRYMEKRMTTANIQDNCKKEFKYAVRRHTEAKMIPVIMEPEMKDCSKWSGPLAMELGGTLWVDLSDTAFDSSSTGFSRLCDEINGRLPGRAGPRRASLVMPATTPAAQAFVKGASLDGNDDDDMIDFDNGVDVGVNDDDLGSPTPQ